MTTAPHRVSTAAPLPTVPLSGTLSAGVDYAFSDRRDGTMSSVVGDGDHADARAVFADRMGLTPSSVSWMHQVHGADVVDARAAAATAQPEPPACDGIVEVREGYAVAVLVADCVPVLMAAPGGVAAAHAGREGLLAGVVEATLASLCRVTEAPAERISAVIGPAIGGCCYEVGEDMAAAVEARLPGTRARTTWGTTSLDLVAGVRHRLAEAGVIDVVRAGDCTRCGGDGRWYSHRATGGDESRPAGRQAGVVARRRQETS